MAQSIEEFLSQTGIPEAGLTPITSKVEEYLQLVTQNNKLIAQINAARAQDPNNVDYLDSLWKAAQASGDKEIAPIAEQFDAIAEEYEKLNAQLRELAKKHVPQALSEEDTKAARKTVNEMAPTIGEARKAAAAMLTIPESVLTAMQVKLPEGGLASLLPEAESLKNARGRKAANASGETKVYATRVNDILIDGESTQVNGKGKIAYAAEKLSEKFNAAQVPANKVTAEEIEEAYFKSLPGSIEFRGLRSTELPDEHSFTFTKNIQVQNKNDDSFTEVQQSVKLTLRSVNYGQEKKAEVESAPAEKVEAKPENVKPAETAKAEPAKKAAAPAPKK